MTTEDVGHDEVKKIPPEKKPGGKSWFLIEQIKEPLSVLHLDRYS